MSLWVVVGGQFGSEGKGKISAFITLQEDIDICVRCGGPNSGHSFVGPKGTTTLLRQLPTGYVRPRTRLLIAAGALITPQVLKAELDGLGIDPRRVGVDRNTMVIEDADRQNEQRLMLRERLSSTLCGVGSAVSRRALRREDVRLAKDVVSQYPWMTDLLTDVSAEANEALDSGKRVLVEGTQGFGLSLYHTAEYPKATSRDTTAAGFLSEVGLSPRLVSEIVVVFRTFPIRVAGYQAGELYREVSWEIVRAESGYPRPIGEFTSVTKTPRRVGRFDWNLARRAVDVNRPTRLAITGLDYIDFGSYGLTDLSGLTSRVQLFLCDVDERLGVPVVYASASPRLEHTFVVPTVIGSEPVTEGGGRRGQLRGHWT
jgi:adenylosuccinate synthase